MPFRFDNTEIPGLLSIDGYIDLAERSPEDVAALILKRLEANPPAQAKDRPSRRSRPAKARPIARKVPKSLRTNRGMAEGRKYHAFISYRHGDADEAFARRVLQTVEAAGFKAAIDERDFDANATFLEEMERCTRESEYTLAVLSSRYLESGNTHEEAIICKVLDMAERKRRLVPLIIEKVERPVWLYSIVGIDFTKTNPLVDPFERLKQMLAKSP